MRLHYGRAWRKTVTRVRIAKLQFPIAGGERCIFVLTARSYSEYKMSSSQRLISLTTFGCVGVAVSVLLAGCSSPRGLGHEPSPRLPVADAAQSEVESAFAREAGVLPIGSSALFDKTPIGTAQVSALMQYTNGLGEVCTKVELKTQTSKSLAGLCEGKDGVWRYVPLSN